MTEFTVPELGENVVSGDVAKVLVKVGDSVRLEQPVIELETDKATIEVPSTVAGVVADVKVKKGDKVKVGAVIFTVGDSVGAAAPAAAPAAAAPAAKAAEPAAEPPKAAPAMAVRARPEPAGAQKTKPDRGRP